jgi:hypothetical protein
VNNYVKNVNKKTKKVDMEIIMCELSERFGWTYDEILNTPEWYIDLIIEKKSIDAKIQS